MCGQMIDDIDLKAYNVQHIRRQISVVSQEPVLFDCSISENITYGLEDPELVPMDQIIAAARSANIHDFIVSLNEVYNTFDWSIQLNCTCIESHNSKYN